MALNCQHGRVCDIIAARPNGTRIVHMMEKQKRPLYTKGQTAV